MDSVTVIKVKPRGGKKFKDKYVVTLVCPCGKTKKFIRDTDEPMPGKWYCGECWGKRSSP